MTVLTKSTQIPSSQWAGRWERVRSSRACSIFSVFSVLLIAWFAAAIYLNAPRVIEQFGRDGVDWTTLQFVDATWSMKRPVLPTPYQVFEAMWQGIVGANLSSPRNLLYHTGRTLSSTLVGFLFGSIFGISIAVGILYVPTLDRSLMPWVIASQTIPILAIAPIIVVVLGNIGLTGLAPKVVISSYTAFFPITIGMVKGLRSPDPMQLDLMRTYSASRLQVFTKLRWPASIQFLFPSLKVAIALSLVGAIVGELAAGGGTGLGARLLIGAYYGLMLILWSALMMAALLSMGCIGVVALVERFVAAGRGGRI